MNLDCLLWWTWVGPRLFGFSESHSRSHFRFLFFPHYVTFLDYLRAHFPFLTLLIDSFVRLLIHLIEWSIFGEGVPIGKVSESKNQLEGPVSTPNTCFLTSQGDMRKFLMSPYPASESDLNFLRTFCSFPDGPRAEEAVECPTSRSPQSLSERFRQSLYGKRRIWQGVWTSENVRKARNRASNELVREMEIDDPHGKEPVAQVRFLLAIWFEVNLQLKLRSWSTCSFDWIFNCLLVWVRWTREK